MGGNVLIQGSERQIASQRSGTYDIYIQVRNSGIEIDPRDIRYLTLATDSVSISGDIVQISGQAITTNISGNIVQISGQTITITSGQIVITTNSQFTPIEKSVIHNQTLPEINTNWLDTDIIPTNTPTLFRIEVSVSIKGKFSTSITRGGNTQITTFKDATDLNPDALNIFDILVHSGDSINFRYSTTNGIIHILRIQEIDSASQ